MSGAAVIAVPPRLAAASLWRHASGLTRVALTVLIAFLLVAASSWLGLWGEAASTTTGLLHGPMSAEHWLGTNAIGQDIAARAAAGAATAFETGLAVAIMATLTGGLLGLLAGYYHARWPDHLVSWLLAVLDAVPFYLLVGALAYAAQGAPGTIVLALTLAFWTTTARLVRAEALKLRETGFVLAALTQGVSDWKILCRHIAPNAAHLLLIQGTITFVAAVKSEVVLSFLGLGDGRGISWGQIIAESSQDILAGHFTGFVVASGALILLVAAMNLIADDLQDFLDPRYQRAT